MNAEISFFVEGDIQHPFLDQENEYRQWLIKVAEAEKKTVKLLNYIFCSDECLLDINIKYLGHDYYTDIITFPYQQDQFIESDLYLSIDRIEDNAKEYGETFHNELLRVMVHGLLHLMGYGDKTEEDTRIMREKEDYYIAVFPV